MDDRVTKHMRNFKIISPTTPPGEGLGIGVPLDISNTVHFLPVMQTIMFSSLKSLNSVSIDGDFNLPRKALFRKFAIP